MISMQIRRYAIEVNANTGRSIQEILRDFVAAAVRGFITFGPINLCTVCGSKGTRIIITRRNDEAIIRTHRCDFCNNTFRSEEKIESIQRIDKGPEPIAEKKKKPHIKKRGR